MAVGLHTIGLQNLDQVIHIINESSRGMSFEYHLDTWGFLSLSRYWNFSYEHSVIGCVEDEPGALMINCTDPQVHDAYTFYWGALPNFRSRRISLPLFDECCKKLRDDGYIMLYGDAVPDRPVRRYRFIQAQPQYILVQMQAQSPNLPDTDPLFEVRKVDIGTLSQLVLPPGESLHWCQRHAFLRNAALFLQFVGAFAGDVLKAYAVVFPQSSNTTLLDLRSPESCFAPGYELLRWLLVQNYRPPFIATYVVEQSYAHHLLTAAGFRVKRQFSTLSRDLRATCSAKAGHV